MGKAEGEVAAGLLGQECGTQRRMGLGLVLAQTGIAAQMHVAVDQPRGEPAARPIKHRGINGVERALADGNDAAIADQHFGAMEGQVAFGRDDGDVAYQQVPSPACAGRGKGERRQGPETQVT